MAMNSSDMPAAPILRNRLVLHRCRLQIIAMGGGGFRSDSDNLLMDRYILEKRA